MLTLPALITLEKNQLSSKSAWLILLTVTMPDATIIRVAKNNEDVLYQGERFSAFNFTLEAVDNNHGVLFGNTRNLQGIETGVFKVSAEMAAEIRDTRNVCKG